MQACTFTIWRGGIQAPLKSLCNETIDLKGKIEDLSRKRLRRGTFRMGSDVMNDITADRSFGSTNWPLGLLMSEHTWKHKEGCLERLQEGKNKKGMKLTV
jgi:hypothetical protein